MGRFVIEDAVREGAKARIALAGPPGSGKTWTALTLAVELAGGGEILVIDTERRSASLYADVFAFRTIHWTPPYDPRELAHVVTDAADRFAVVVADSLSHFWSGEGGTLSIVDHAAAKARDNRFAGWKSGTPAQNEMVDALLAAPCHLIATMRSKLDYVQERDAQGKTRIRRVGMAPIQRDGIEYEFGVTADLDVDHNLVVAKTRCSLLAGRTFRPGAAAEMGRALAGWLDGASAEPPVYVRRLPTENVDQRGPDMGRPFEAVDEVLAGPEWARTFTRAVRDAGWSGDISRALVEHATGGRTGSPKAVRADEVEAVRAAYRRLGAGGLERRDVGGGVVLVALPDKPTAA